MHALLEINLFRSSYMLENLLKFNKETFLGESYDSW